MEMKFSPRGTGACPLCRKQQRCIIRKDIQTALRSIPDSAEKDLELVIYVCPAFDEKA